MSDENSTHFQFRLGGIELEISGDRGFVEAMYTRVMKDIEGARERVSAAGGTALEEREALDRRSYRERQIVWVHRCNSMMHKIYMSCPAEIDGASILRPLEAARLGIVFADSAVFERILPGGGKGHTLWAELTAKGRRRIALAAPE